MWEEKTRKAMVTTEKARLPEVCTTDMGAEGKNIYLCVRERAGW